MSGGSFTSGLTKHMLDVISEPRLKHRPWKLEVWRTSAMPSLSSLHSLELFGWPS